MNPQDYSARAEYRPPAAWYRRLNWLGVLLTSLGLAPANAVTLEVRGRKSGKIRRVPILRTRYEDHDYLVALAGESQWVRNARASAGRVTIRRRRKQRAILHELPPAARAPVIAEYLRLAADRGSKRGAARQARFYFGLEPNPAARDITGIVDYYPVFQIEYL